MIAAGLTGDLVIQLADGTYRLASTLRFTAADGGSDGHTVYWQAAAGAHPVLSGATRITGWTLSDPSRNLYSAPVAAGLATRQLYVKGVRAQIAQGPPSVALKFTTQSSGDPYYAAADATYASWRNPSSIEFVYPPSWVHPYKYPRGGNGPWTETRCRVAGITGTNIRMSQPCWHNSVTQLPDQNGSYGFRQACWELICGAPGRIENAYELLQTGQWYLDSSAHTLYYQAPAGTDMSTADVEAPSLQTLVDIAGTRSRPVRNLSFSGLIFAYATWLAPSTPTGFSETGANLTMTNGVANPPTGTCTFTKPNGTCPYGAYAQEPSNVTVAYAHHVAFTRNTFTHLGAGGLTLGDGVQHSAVNGNLFTDISGNGVQIGNADNPNPSSHLDVNSFNLVENNLITDIGAEYHGGVGIVLWFSQHTSISHNDIHDVPYAGIISGITAGHANTPHNPDQTTNNNLANTISHNVIYDVMQGLDDAGAIYTEGSQGQTRYTLNPITTVDDGSPLVTYTGTWSAEQSESNRFYGTEHLTSANNASFSHVFTGTGIDYVTAEGTKHGQVGVYIDNKLYGTFDCYAATPRFQQVCARVRGLPSGTHSIKIVKLNGDVMSLDALNLPNSAYVNERASYAGGLTLTGNVAFNAQYRAYYNDVGSQWLTWEGNAEWNVNPGNQGAGYGGNSGCGYVGHISFTKGYAPDGVGRVSCPEFGTPTDTTYDNNITTPAIPGPGTLATATLNSAGIEPDYTSVYSGQPAHVGYATKATGMTTAPTTILIAGSGFLRRRTTVNWGEVAATRVSVASASFLTAVAPVGVNLANLAVNTPSGPTIRQVDDTDPAITYTGPSWAAGVITSSGSGEYSTTSQYAGTQHYATSNGDSFSYIFTGTGINYITAEGPNRGAVSIAIDGQFVRTANCYLPVLAYKRLCASITGLQDGNHTVTITKAGGTYMSIDALRVVASIKGHRR